MTLIRGLDFLPSVNHNYGALLGNFGVVHGGHAVRRRQHRRRADHRSGDGVFDKVYPSTPGLRYLHISQGVTNSMSYSNLGMSGGAVQQL